MRILSILCSILLLASCTNDKAITEEDLKKEPTKQKGFGIVDKNKIERVIKTVYAVDHRFQSETFDIMPLLSKELLRQCVGAKATEQQSASLTKGNEKPAIIESEIFASLHEGYSSAEIVELKKDGANCIATIEFTFSFDETEPQDTWQDKLVLVEQEDGWKLDNVIYGEGRNYPKDLKTLLKEFDEKNWVPEK